jgi:hypothetical protein
MPKRVAAPVKMRTMPVRQTRATTSVPPALMPKSRPAKPAKTGVTSARQGQILTEDVMEEASGCDRDHADQDSSGIGEEEDIMFEDREGSEEGESVKKRVVRARARHVCDSCASPAAYAPSRARRLCRAHARSSGEGAARPPLCADEAGELVSWSGRGHRGCSRRCLSRAGVCTPVLGSLTRPAAGARCWWRFQVLAVLVEVSGPRSHRRRRHTACRRGNWKFARRARLAKRDSSVQHNTQ